MSAKLCRLVSDTETVEDVLGEGSKRPPDEYRGCSNDIADLTTSAKWS